MRLRGIAVLRFLSVMAAIAMGNASGSLAADSNQSSLIEERVGHGGSIFHSKTTSTPSGNCEATAKGTLVEERVGHGGSIARNQTTGHCDLMAEQRSKGRLVEERIGHGGWVYRQAIN